MAGQNSTMFSKMARLFCTLSPFSPCIKKNIKRTNYIIKSLPAHVWPQFNNVLHNGQAVVYRTPSPSSLCIKKSVKRTNYIIKTSRYTAAWNFMMFSTMARLLCSPSSLCKEKRKKDKLYLKSLPAHSWPKFNNILYNDQAVVHTVSLLSVYKEKHEKYKLYYNKPPGTRLAQVQLCSLQ
jgi:hypothetical protein